MKIEQLLVWAESIRSLDTLTKCECFEEEGKAILSLIGDSQMLRETLDSMVLWATVNEEGLRKQKREEVLTAARAALAQTGKDKSL
jgi:hypothetical protein